MPQFANALASSEARPVLAGLGERLSAARCVRAYGGRAADAQWSRTFLSDTVLRLLRPIPSPVSAQAAAQVGGARALSGTPEDSGRHRHRGPDRPCRRQTARATPMGSAAATDSLADRLEPRPAGGTARPTRGTIAEQPRSLELPGSAPETRRGGLAQAQRRSAPVAPAARRSATPVETPLAILISPGLEMVAQHVAQHASLSPRAARGHAAPESGRDGAGERWASPSRGRRRRGRVLRGPGAPASSSSSRCRTGGGPGRGPPRWGSSLVLVTGRPPGFQPAAGGSGGSVVLDRRLGVPGGQQASSCQGKDFVVDPPRRLR